MTHGQLYGVYSTTGSIDFDTNIDNQAEMHLNATGLGISAQPSANLHVGGNALVSEQLFIGGDSGSSNLNIHGSRAFIPSTISSNTILSNSTLVFVDSSAGNLVVTLPDPS